MHIKLHYEQIYYATLLLIQYTIEILQYGGWNLKFVLFLAYFQNTAIPYTFIFLKAYYFNDQFEVLSSYQVLTVVTWGYEFISNSSFSSREKDRKTPLLTLDYYTGQTKSCPALFITYLQLQDHLLKVIDSNAQLPIRSKNTHIYSSPPTPSEK